MKKLSLILFTICTCLFAQSQNVGIGTTNPAGKLHIKGSADTSQLIIDASSTQSNNHPLIRLRDASGNDLLDIHSDDVTNTFMGLNTGKNNSAATGGTHNTFIGSGAGFSNTTGSSNIAIGGVALYNNTTGGGNIAIGNFALQYNTGDFNYAVGSGALYKNTSGSNNTANGINALHYNTTGDQNSAAGFGSLYSNTTGNKNTANGYQSLFYNTEGWSNIANGYQSLYSNTTGSGNIAIGLTALYWNTAGEGNNANGFQALFSNTTGNLNSASGTYAFNSNTIGSYNTVHGAAALTSTTGSNNNTAVGYSAGSIYDNGSDNIFLGAFADVNSPYYSNVISIGTGTVGTASNQVTIGNSSSNSYRVYANWSNISNGRFKRNVQDNVPGLDFITKLHPVTYNLNAMDLDAFLHKKNGKRPQMISTGSGDMNDRKPVQPMANASKAVITEALRAKETVVYTGFVAQEVELTAKKLRFNFSGIDAPKNESDVYGLRYAEFVVPLVKAVQEQQVMIEKLRKQVESASEAGIAEIIRKQQQIIEDLKIRIEVLEKK